MKNFPKFLFLSLLIFGLQFGAKKIHRFYLFKKIHALKTVSVQGEGGFVAVNQWLTLCERLNIRRVTRYQGFLPKLGPSFLNKIKAPEPWMLELLNKEFAFHLSLQPEELINSFSNFVSHVNKKGGAKNKPLNRKKETLIDDCQCHNDYASQGLVRFKIDQGTLYVKNYGLSEKINPFTIFLNHLHKYIGLPDIDFFLDLNDFVTSIDEQYLPIFSFCKKKDQHFSILIPDCEILRGYNKIDKVLNESGDKFPWAMKKEISFWRGSTTNGLYNLPCWKSYPRSQLTFLSLEYPQDVDARFTRFIQGARDNPDFMSFQRIHGEKVSIGDSLCYKYLIDIDGNASTYSRFYWILRSNCLPLKQDSDFIQWYYGALKPYQHFVPFSDDCSDLISQIDWARTHDETAKQIAEESAYFAEKMLSTESAYLYLYFALMEYHNLFKNSK